jgi:hypothetical protein
MADRSKQISGFHPWAVRGASIVLAVTVLSIGGGHRPSAAQTKPPCVQIKDACTEAGFKVGAAREGIGLVVDCIRPVMQGVPQRPKATKPLPQIDAALIAACKERNPKFGQDAAKPQ